jgi:hypothetical protein
MKILPIERLRAPSVGRPAGAVEAAGPIGGVA